MRYPRVKGFQKTEDLSSLEKRSYFNEVLKAEGAFQLSGISVDIRGHF